MIRTQRLAACTALGIVLFAQLACQTLIPSRDAVSTSQPTLSEATPIQENDTTTNATALASPSDDEIRAGIQHSLDLYAQAYNENDPQLLTQVEDQENLPFRRIVKSRFDEFQTSSDAGQIRFKYDLLDIEKREFGYVIAHFEMDGFAVEALWPFRLLDGNWVLTEPTVEQIGEPVTTET